MALEIRAVIITMSLSLSYILSMADGQLWCKAQCIE